jgi:hypothetical protein
MFNSFVNDIDNKYKIGEKIAPAIEQMRVTDEKYKITQQINNASEKTQSCVAKIDDEYQISSKAKCAVDLSIKKV